MKKHEGVAVILFALLLAFGCAGSKNGKVTRQSSNVITADDIATVSASNAYEAVQMLRPHLLHRQSTRYESNVTGNVPMTAKVYLDGVQYGDIESLQGISAFSIAEIRYLNASEATLRFGTNHAGGAFVVTTK
ncbi:MAG TPA: TonB-dependent receptor plug domain-containing protein [bacterium]